MPLIQISQTPGKEIALIGVVLALIGLCASLFIRPRRVWVRALPAPAPAGAGPGDGPTSATMDGTGGTRVEVAVLDRSGNGEVDVVLTTLLEQLQEEGSNP